jgi:hypothetical protein
MPVLIEFRVTEDGEVTGGLEERGLAGGGTEVADGFLSHCGANCMDA